MAWLKKHTGFALIEAMMAVLILAIVASILGTYLSNQKTISVKIEGSSACRSDVESLIRDFNDTSNSTIINYIPGLGLRVPPISVQALEVNYSPPPYPDFDGTSGKP